MSAIALAAMLALAFRTASLDTYGFSADELNKVQAIDDYRAGRFSANAEHPMLMKLAMWASVDASAGWNRLAPPQWSIPLEAAVRLPNAVAGAATTIVLSGIANVLFGGAAAVAVALIWATDVNAIAINRIGKEDTLFVFFFLLAVFCYERAKQRGAVDPDRVQRWYGLSGAAFGLMLASKYLPHFVGIYALFNVMTDPEPGRNKPNRLIHFGCMLAAFALADAAVFLPETWRYCVHYMRGGLLTHHGYVYDGGVYVNTELFSPAGVPTTYYLRAFASKIPLVLLAAVVPGVIQLIRRWHQRGFVLLRVLLLTIVVPYSLIAPKFLRYMLPMLAVIDLVAAVGLVEGVSWLLRKQWLAPITRVTVAAAAIAVFAVGLLDAQLEAEPFYSQFQNAIGARWDPGNSAFPEAAYDYGVREAAAAIAAVAQPSAVVASDAHEVVDHYLRQFGRSDIRAASLSLGGIPGGGSDVWVVDQPAHTTFENRSAVEQLRGRERPWAQYHAGNVLAAQVFRIGGR